MVETIRSLGHPRLLLCYVYMCYVYNSGEPGWYESGERETTSVVSGHARAAVETVVDVPDHGDALSPDREETIMIIQFER